MSSIGECAYYVRSKNAGPFWVTIDIFFNNLDSYQKVARSEKLNKERIGAVYRIPSKSVKFFYLENLQVIKISYPRLCPQGGKDERDMHAGQQYIEILDLEV